MKVVIPGSTMPGPSLDKLDFLNVFKFCSKCLRVLGHVMVLLVMSLVVVTVYSVLSQWCPMLVQGSVIRRIGAGLAISVFLFLVSVHSRIRQVFRISDLHAEQPCSN